MNYSDHILRFASGVVGLQRVTGWQAVCVATATSSLASAGR